MFPEQEVAKRKAECLSAIRQDEDNPSVRAVETLLRDALRRVASVRPPAKGTVESVERITRGDLVAFHAERFRPAALSLAIVGHVDAGHALTRARSSSMAGPACHSMSLRLRPRRRSSRASGASIDLPGKSQSEIAYGFTAIRRLDPRYDAYFVMNNILGQFGLGGRLADNIRERQGMAYYAFSSLDPSVGVGPLIVRAGVDPDNVERAIEAIDHEVRAAGPDGADRRGAGRDAAVPDRLDSADARNQRRHRVVPADRKSSSASASTTIAGWPTTSAP